jgi:exodeoxyribonuclease VII small subunit
MNYPDLTAELESILHTLEHQPDLPLDELTQKVQRAYALVGEGRQQLRTAEAAIYQLIESFEADEADTTTADGD